MGAPVRRSGVRVGGVRSPIQELKAGGYVQVPEARPELTPRPGRGGELDAAPAGAGKRRSFSLTLVSLVASPLAVGPDGRRARVTDR